MLFSSCCSTSTPVATTSAAPGAVEYLSLSPSAVDTACSPLSLLIEICGKICPQPSTSPAADVTNDQTAAAAAAAACCSNVTTAATASAAERGCLDEVKASPDEVDSTQTGSCRIIENDHREVDSSRRSNCNFEEPRSSRPERNCVNRGNNVNSIKDEIMSKLNQISSTGSSTASCCRQRPSSSSAVIEAIRTIEAQQRCCQISVVEETASSTMPKTVSGLPQICTSGGGMLDRLLLLSSARRPSADLREMLKCRLGSSVAAAAAVASGRRTALMETDPTSPASLNGVGSAHLCGGCLLDSGVAAGTGTVDPTNCPYCLLYSSLFPAFSMPHPSNRLSVNPPPPTPGVRHTIDPLLLSGLQSNPFSAALYRATLSRLSAAAAGYNTDALSSIPYPAANQDIQDIRQFMWLRPGTIHQKYYRSFLDVRRPSVTSELIQPLAVDVTPTVAAASGIHTGRLPSLGLLAADWSSRATTTVPRHLSHSVSSILARTSQSLQRHHPYRR